MEYSRHVHWANINKDEYCESMASSSSFSSSSLSSSSSSLDLSDDASSSSPSGPLYQLAADLMYHLPIKRGLSKFYDGKSQTFASLASVKSVEDLAKNHRTRRIKASSFSRNLNHHKFGPKPTITKRSPKRSLSPSFATAKLTMLIHT